MFCPFCGHENRDAKKFCRQCGRAIPARKSVTTSYLPPLPELGGTEFPPPEVPSAIASTTSAKRDNGNSSVASSPTLNYNPAAFNEQSSESVRTVSSSGIAEVSAVETPVLPKANDSGSLEDQFEQLEQFTQQLLPDTIGFEIPKGGSPSFDMDTGEHVRVTNGAPRTPMADNLGLKNPTMNAPSDSLRVAFNSGALEDGNAPTDEIEVLDRTLDKTAEVPIIKELKEPQTVIERPVANLNRALPGLLSTSLANEGVVENGKRQELILLSVAAGLAIIGLIVIIWVVF